jgi:ribonuclease R
MENVISFEQLQEIGRHISFTERRADDAERELRQVKILELLKDRVGEQFVGVVTGITNFGIFVQISEYLIDGLIRYEDLMDDWWDVDERSGLVRGQRTGTKIGIGDVVRVTVVNVDVARRELNLAVAELLGRAGRPAQPQAQTKSKHAMKNQKNRHERQGQRGGGKRPGKHFSRRHRR